MDPIGDMNPVSQIDVAIVGGGLAGLACALRVREAGLSPLILESSDEVGGRVRTDRVDGFLIDRGFQVYLSAYPEAGELLDLEELELCHFRPGALLLKHGRLHRVMDIFREPADLIASGLSPIGSIGDKLLVAELKRRLHGKSIGDISKSVDLTTEAWLRQFGFSETMIDEFFRSFYGGIFLERELRTSSQMFEFTFGLFSRGFASLPAGGMGEIPLQLARRLPNESIRRNTPVRSIHRNTLTLEDESQLEAKIVVVATDGTAASHLVPEMASPPLSWRSVTGVYFAAPESPLKEPIIALNGSGEGMVNSVAVLSDVAPGYSPDDRALISVTVLGECDRAIEAPVREELREWFGCVDSWEHLRTDRIERGLPEQPPGCDAFSSRGFLEVGDTLICGDHCTFASIEGAIASGQRAGNRVVEKLTGKVPD